MELRVRTARQWLRRGWRALGLAAMAAVLIAASAAAAPEMRLLPRWQAHSMVATLRVDHGPWDRFLQTYVAAGADGINRVAYGKVTAADRQALAAYIKALGAIEVDRLTRDQQMAYWINLYNAVTVKVVLDHYPVNSIRDINLSKGFFATGPWGAKLVTVDGVPLSLDEIEHSILRPIWRDARIHYALNCASLGCPNLALTAYTAERLKLMLEVAARSFVNHPRGVKVTDAGIEVSSIYKWYADDFGGARDYLLDHLLRYAAPELKEQIEDSRRIVDYHYDWRLNDAAQVK